MTVLLVNSTNKPSVRRLASIVAGVGCVPRTLIDMCRVRPLPIAHTPLIILNGAQDAPYLTL